MPTQAAHQDYFIWNGVDCRNYGIHVSEQPPITIPQEQSTQTTVPGRPGSLTTLEGEDVYDDLVLAAECFISDPAQIPAIAGRCHFCHTDSPIQMSGFYESATDN